MKISLVQFSADWENKSSSMKKIDNLMKGNSRLGKMVIFPEMTLTGFTMNASSMAESMKGKSLNFFSKFAVEKKVHVFTGIIEKSGNGFFNTLVHIDANGKLKTKYRKIHPFSFSKEDKFYSKGKKLNITEVDGWKIGLSICYDLRFPELYRLYAKEKVDLIINIANWPIARIEHWRTLLKARAIENQCYIAGVNRVGKDLKLNYSGFSSVFDPMGKEIVSMKDEEKIITAEIDKDYVKEVRKKLPFLEDMRLI